MIRLVGEFHRKHGVVESRNPELISVEFRRALIEEEHRELQEAIDERNISAIAKELMDCLYVLIGAARVWGIPIERCFAEVHRSNMSKAVNPGSDKIPKGPDYVPADIDRALGRSSS